MKRIILLVAFVVLIPLGAWWAVSHWSRAGEKPVTYIEFRFAIREGPLRSGEVADSGTFHPVHQTVNVPVEISSGPGESSAFADGVWVDVRWRDVEKSAYQPSKDVQPRPRLILRGFQYRIRNGVTTGNSTWGPFWLGPQDAHLIEEWGHFLTPTHIRSDIDSPAMFQQWRWSNPKAPPPVKVAMPATTQPAESPAH